MTTITTRSGKGSPLTNDEVDANFTNLNTDKAELSGANFTGNIDVTGRVQSDEVVSDGVVTVRVPGAGSTTEALTIYNTDGASNNSQVQLYFGANDYNTTGRGLRIDAGRDSGADGIATFYAVDQAEHSDYEAIKILTDGGVTLSYLGSNTLATTSSGIDVTGTATADAFEVDDTDDIRLRFLNASTFKAGLQVATTAGDMIATSTVDDLAIRSQSDILFATGGNTERMKIVDTGIDVTGTVTADAYDIGTLGTLGSVATDRLFIATADGLGLQFDFDNSRIVPVGADGSTYNNNVSLGSSGLEFKNLLLSGNATVGGTVTADGISSNGDVTITSTDTGASYGPNLTLRRDSASPADNDFIGRILWQGDNSAGENTSYAALHTRLSDVTDGTEDGLVQLDVMVDGTATNLLDVGASGIVMNDGSADVDFRVESNALTHALFVDAGNNTVNIGRSSGPAALNVQSDSGADGIAVYGRSSDEISQITMYNSGGTGLSQLQTRPQYFDIRSLADVPVIISPNASGKFYVYSGETVVNENSADHDFRVESDNQANMLFVEAQSDRIGIAESAPESQLHIKQTSDIGNGNSMGLMIESGTSTQRYMLQTGRTGVSNAYFNLRDVSNGRDIWSVLDTNGTFQGHTPFEWNNAAVFNNGGLDYDFRVESDNNQYALFVDASENKTTFNTSYTADAGVVTIRGTYGAHNASDYRGNNALALTGADPGSTSAGAGINLAFVPVTNRGATAVISGENVSTNKEGGAQLRFSVGGGSFPTTQKDMLMLNYDSGAIFNEGGADLDFRVESDNNANMLFVDGGNSRVGVGTGSPTEDLEVSGANPTIKVTATTDNWAAFDSQAGDTQANYVFFRDSGAERARISVLNSEDFYISTGSTPVERLKLDGSAAVFNETGADVDFRVESDNKSHAIFLDAANNKIAFNNTTSAVGTSDTSLLFRMPQAAGKAVFVHDSGDGGVIISGSGAASQAALMFGNNWTTDSGAGYTEEYRIVMDGADDSLQFNYNANATTALTLKSTGTVVVNDDSADADFRVEGNSNSHLISVDAATDLVGLGISPVDYRLHVETITGGNAIKVTRGSGTMMKLFQSGDGTTHIGSSGATGKLIFRAGNTFGSDTERMSIANGSIVVNEDSKDVDFRVESDSNANAFFVDAGTSRVGINKSNPGAHLHITGNNESDGASLKLQEANNNTSDTLGTIFFGNNSADQLGRIIGFTSGTATTCTLRFMSTSNGGTTVNNLDLASSNVTFNENGADCDFRVESDNSSYGIYLDAANDRLLVGRGDVSTGEDFFAVDVRPGTTGHVVRTGRDDNSTKNHFVFLNPNGTVGSIQTTGSSTLFNTSSDARLKENIADADDAGELIDAIQVRQFDWITDGEHQRYGMVAQELNTVAPEAVSEGETEDDMMAVDYSKLVPMLVKEIQSLRARVAQLESN